MIANEKGIGRDRATGMRKIGFWFDPSKAPPPAPGMHVILRLFVGVLAVSVQDSLLEPSEFVDHQWSLNGNRQTILRHMKTNGRVHETYFGDSWCRFGCKHAAMGNKDMTDGKFIWPEGYAHYIEAHDVKPPEEFIQHVLTFYRLGAQ